MYLKCNHILWFLLLACKTTFILAVNQKVDRKINCIHAYNYKKNYLGVSKYVLPFNYLINIVCNVYQFTILY